MTPDYSDVDAEREVVGALILDNDIYSDFRPILNWNMFTSHHLGATYKVFGDQFQKAGLLDLHTIADIAKVSTELLADCMTEVSIPAVAVKAARRVADLALKREVQRKATRVLAQLGILTPEEIAKELSEIATSLLVGSSAKAVYDATALCHRVMKLQEQRVEQSQSISEDCGPRTGYDILDRLLRGLAPKRITVIAAATGFGKSTLALNILSNVVNAGHRALFISNENDIDLNLDRLCGILSGAMLKEIESGSRYKVALDFGQRFHNSGLFMTDNSPRTIEEVAGTINRHAIQQGIKVAFVDYIGEISHSGDPKEPEEARLARYAQKLVDCAKSLQIHIIIMAQLNRQGIAKGRPTKAELAGCFKIAQKAHSLLLFWQDEKKRDILTVDKNRQGPSGIDIEMKFNRTTQQISEGTAMTSD